MESEILEKFKTELSAVSEKKILSKAKIQSITKAALKAKSNYKHVVYNIERLMAKSNPPQRLSTLYIIDSIIRASKHQLKEKDVFGPRFIKLFDRILDHMLRCGHKEQLKTIRMLNLWMSNRVYPEAEIQPFREKFKNAGVVISFEEVEKAVKGADADMSIYSGTYKKKAGSKSKSDKRHQSSSATAPSLARHDMPTFSLSEEILDGTISEREMMELAQQAKIDGASLLGNNRELLQKVLQVFSSCLKQSISEGDNGNKIQNVLTKDFEYSDDEEDKEKEPEDVEPKKLTHNEVLS
uniref:CID domain-containing protein n=1 Tax=Caenorhabditis japonica TaxID=281687 RepID=A0A8R1DR23_CAEJA